MLVTWAAWNGPRRAGSLTTLPPRRGPRRGLEPLAFPRRSHEKRPANGVEQFWEQSESLGAALLQSGPG